MYTGHKNRKDTHIARFKKFVAYDVEHNLIPADMFDFGDNGGEEDDLEDEDIDFEGYSKHIVVSKAAADKLNKKKKHSNISNKGNEDLVIIHFLSVT